jgi:hypothetical protein
MQEKHENPVDFHIHLNVLTYFSEAFQCQFEENVYSCSQGAKCRHMDRQTRQN